MELGAAGPELDTPKIKRSVFVLPAARVKNRQARVVILNDVAQSVLEEMRGEHPLYALTWEDREGQRDRVGHFRNSGWIQARRRPAARYAQELGREAPEGFRNVRVHDLRPRHLWATLAGRWRVLRGPPGPPGSPLDEGHHGLQRGGTPGTCWMPPTECKSPARVPQ
jgi:hypothetical protein